MKFKAFCVIAVIMLFSMTASYAVQRVVIAEMHTNTLSPNCRNANTELDQIVENHPTRLAVIRYHAWWPSEYDPFYIYNETENFDRITYYPPHQDGYRYVPYAWISGIYGSYTYMTWEARIVDEMQIESPIEIEIGGNYNSESRSGELDISIFAADEIIHGNLKLRIALTESNIFWHAPNGMDWHHQTFRDMIPGTDGISFSIDEGQTIQLNQSFSCPETLVIENCEFVVFAQSDADRNILQGAKINILELVEMSYQLDRFSLIRPADDSTINNYYPEFIWQSSDDPDSGYAINYEVYVDTDSSFGEPFISDQMSDTSWFCDQQLADNTTYYWKVLASNGHAPDRFSREIYSFAIDIYGSIEGVVKDSENDVPISGVLVQAGYTSIVDTTNEDGSYFLTGIDPGSHNIHCFHEYYHDTTIADIIVEADSIYVLNISLERLPLDDVGVSAILSPPDSMINNTVYPLIAEITNYFVGGFTFDVVFEVYDQDSFILMMADTVSITDMPGFCNDTITFGENFEPLYGADYIFKAYTTLNGDINSGNDATIVYSVSYDWIKVWYGNLDGSPITANIGGLFDVFIYNQTSTATYIADVLFCLGTEDQYIDSSYSVANGELYYPFNTWDWAIFTATYGSPPNPEAWSSQSFLGVCEIGPPYDSPWLHSEVPIQVLKMVFKAANDSLIMGETVDCLGSGLDAIQGPSNAGDTIGYETYPVIEYFSPVHFEGEVAIDEIKHDHPLRLEIAQNYPNPFNVTTLISYSIPEDVFVIIEIYDILGQQVETLVKANRPAGYHEVIWDASAKSSGTYFYKIQAGDFTVVKKMLLLK